MIVQTSCTHPNDGTLCEMQVFLYECQSSLISNNSNTFYIHQKGKKYNKKIISVSMRVDCVFVCDYNRRNHQKIYVHEMRKPMEYTRKSKLALALAHNFFVAAND